MNNRMLTGLLALFLVSAQAYSDDSILIKDMEDLRNSLPYKDPGRPQLTRRLADLYFQQAIDEDKALILTGKGSSSHVQNLRTRAAKLYRESLDGERGTYPPASGELLVKIKFQLARLDKMSGDKVRALTTFKEVALSNLAGNDLRREALLTVAEMYDEDGKWKEAMLAYKDALRLSKAEDTLSYIHYRISWSLFRMGSIKEAQSEIELALWDSQGKPKEQVLADYLQFLASTPGTEGREELSKIESLSAKAGKPELIESLGEAFFAAGNRKAGTTAFSHANRLHPNIFISARLAEEYYGFRLWDELNTEFASIERLSVQLKAQTEKKKTAIDQILRRLVVQIDGERKSNPGKYSDESCKAIDLHLKLFPESDVSSKMREGWLAANSNENQKIERLGIWAKESASRNDTSSEIRYRQDRAALLLKNKNYSEVKEEALRLAILSNDLYKKREWTYLAAKADMDLGNASLALSVFLELAKITENTNPDKWAIQSQNISLAILNKEKRFSLLAEQAKLWTDNKYLKTLPHMAQELAGMNKVRNEALFESAIAEGETEGALKTFISFCTNGQFKEKACENAKVLSVKLKKQDELLIALKNIGDKESLVLELERSGKFSEAASMRENKLIASPKEFQQWLHVATLYQIAGDKAGQMRVLRKFAGIMKKEKSISPEIEKALEATFLSAGMNASELMALPWSMSLKLKLAATFEDLGTGNKVTEKLVASSSEDLGLTWARLMIEKCDAMDLKQRKVSFYGSNSRNRFQMRLRLIGKYAEETKKVLTGASAPVRAYLLSKLQSAYADLDKEIMSTPVPSGLDESQIQEVMAALESLAVPMRDEALAYGKILNEQLTSTEKPEIWANVINGEKEAFLNTLKSESLVTKTTSGQGVDSKEFQKLINALAIDPTDKTALTALRDHYHERGEIAPEAYFSGRLAETKE